MTATVFSPCHTLSSDDTEIQHSVSSWQTWAVLTTHRETGKIMYMRISLCKILCKSFFRNRQVWCFAATLTPDHHLVSPPISVDTEAALMEKLPSVLVPPPSLFPPVEKPPASPRHHRHRDGIKIVHAPPHSRVRNTLLVSIRACTDTHTHTHRNSVNHTNDIRPVIRPLLGWGERASPASKLASTRRSNNPDIDDTDKQIRPEIYFTLKTELVLLQKRDKRESIINTPALSLYTCYGFIFKCKKQRSFLHILPFFYIIQKSSSIWNRCIKNKEKTIIFTQKEGIRSFI